MRTPQRGAAWVAGAVMAIAATWSVSVRAGQPLSIAWDAPAACPDDAALQAALHRWLELTPEGLENGAVQATARVTPHEGGWQLDLTLVSPGGRQEETLVTERCETLVDVVALKVALAADPTGLMRGLQRAHEQPLQPARARDALSLGVRPVFGLSAGILPGTANGVAAVGSLEGGALWRVELGAQLWFPRSVAYPGLPNVGARVGLVAGEARACVLPSLGSLTLPICAGIDLGMMSGTGFGVAQVQTSEQLWAALAFGPALRWQLVGPVSLWLQGEALVAITRPAFHMRNLDLLYRPEPAGAQGWLGIELRLD
jgi:hypothetical protein